MIEGDLYGTLRVHQGEAGFLEFMLPCSTSVSDPLNKSPFGKWGSFSCHLGGHSKPTFTLIPNLGPLQRPKPIPLGSFQAASGVAVCHLS